MIKHLLILLVIGALCYGGVTWIYRQMDDGFSRDNTTGSAADAQQRSRKEPSATIAQSPIDTELITRRNIFLAPDGSGRSGSGTNPLAALEQSEPELILIGTVVHTDGGNRAIIYQVEQKKQLLVKEGDVINGVSIKQILPGKTVVSRRGRSETLDIAAASEFRRAQQRVVDGKDELPAAPSPASNTGARRAAEQTGEEEGQPPLQVDPDKLGEPSEGVIIKGRISS